MSAIVSFLEGVGPDGSGRSIIEVQAFGLEALERHHDFIQWLFPLAEASTAVPGSPVLSDSDIASIRGSAGAQLNVTRSAAVMGRFYADTDHWLRAQDHNHRRITRIIKSLRLLVGDAAANGFRSDILTRVATRRAVISPTTLDYWSRA